MLKDSLNDQMIRDLSKHLKYYIQLINGISNTDLVEIIERGLQDPKLDKALMNPPKVGLGGLFTAFRDDNFQR